MLSRCVLHLIAFVSILLMLSLLSPLQQRGHTQNGNGSVGDVVFDFTDAVQPSTVDGLPWITGVVASHYGSGGGTWWGGFGNSLYPARDFFVALPATGDDLDYLGGMMACRMSRCGDAQPTLDELLSGEQNEHDSALQTFEFWPGSNGIDNNATSWVIEGDEGEGLFRVLEIRPSGREEPVLEAYVGDVGPWNNSDPYWATGSRPDAEDGVDSRGRRTNRAGVDVSYALAQALGFTGLMEVDWRWKTVNGAYVVRRQATEWRW